MRNPRLNNVQTNKKFQNMHRCFVFSNICQKHFNKLRMQRRRTIYCIVFKLFNDFLISYLTATDHYLTALLTSLFLFCCFTSWAYVSSGLQYSVCLFVYKSCSIYNILKCIYLRYVSENVCPGHLKICKDPSHFHQLASKRKLHH